MTSRLTGVRNWGRLIWVLPVVALLGLLVVYPIAVLLHASFVDEPPRPGQLSGKFTLQNYASLATGSNADAFGNSLLLSIVGTVLAVALGTSIAWLATRSDMPGRWLADLAGVMPLFVAPLIGAVAWQILASPRSGYLNMLFDWLGIPFQLNVTSMGGMIAVAGIYYAPYSFLLMSSAFQLFNGEYEEAGMVHGSSRGRVLRTVTLPLLAPSLLASSILTFALILENFTIPEILGSREGIFTLPSRIFRLMNNSPAQPNEAASIGVLLAILMAIAILVQNWILRGKSYVTLTGKGFRPTTVSLGAGRWVALAATLAFMVAAIVLPAFALIIAATRQHQYVDSLSALFSGSQFNLDRFVSVAESTEVRTGLTNSLLLGVMAAVLGCVLFVLLAYIVQRSRLPGRRVVEYLAVAPVGIPAIVLSLGLLWAWLRLPLPVYGTLAILVMGYIVRFLPQGFQGISSSLSQVGPELEDSAHVSGASRFRAALTITLPLIRGGLFSTALLIFILSVRELTVSLFLVSYETQVLPIVLFQHWSNGSLGNAAVLSTVYMVFLLLVSVIFRRWMGALSK